MRDPERIDRIVEKLRAAWHAEPDWRLCQLVINTVDARPAWKLFYVEDHRFEAALDAMLPAETQDASATT